MYIRETLKIIERLELEPRERHAIYEGNLRRLCNGRLGSHLKHARAGKGARALASCASPPTTSTAGSTRKPEETALVAWRTEEEAETRLTWRQLARRAAAAARALERRGRGAGDVVSFQLPNWWEFVALYLATVRLGAVANPLMPIFRRRELAFMLRLAESRVFIAPERFRGFDHGALARERRRRASA